MLTPIETAIDLIRERTRLTRIEVEAEPANLKQLQILLQGSILARASPFSVLFPVQIPFSVPASLPVLDLYFFFFNWGAECGTQR